MNSSTRRTGRARIGGRSARVVQAVLTAAMNQLTQFGYEGMRVDAVADAAGVNKTSVYRRWPTKLELVAAALRARAVVFEEPPNSGTTRDDLVAALARVSEYCESIQFRETGQLLRANGTDPERDALISTLRDEFFSKQAAVIERAIQRGELPPGTDARFVVETLFVTVLAHTMRNMAVLAVATIERLVELVLRGADHGGALMRDAVSVAATRQSVG